jgi:hypothetical protein
LTYFKQLHGEQSFSELFFRMPLLSGSPVNVSDLLHKDRLLLDDDRTYREKYAFAEIIVDAHTMDSDSPRLTSIKNDLEFLRGSMQLPVVEPLDTARLNKFTNIAFNAVIIALQYVRSASNHDEPSANDPILHDIARICIKLGDAIRCSPRLDNARNVFLNYHLLLATLLTKGIQQILPAMKCTSQADPSAQEQAKT